MCAIFFVAVSWLYITPIFHAGKLFKQVEDNARTPLQKYFIILTYKNFIHYEGSIK